MKSLLLMTALSPTPAAARDDSPAPADDPPNVIFVLADDLGHGELGCYGQQRIRTPRLDRLAAEGVRLTQHYSGHCVCAPSRCVLLTGRHTGHAWIRGNSPWASEKNPLGEGQEPLPEGHPTVARWLQDQGYATACIGKWGLGGPGTTGAPRRQGFDHFFGYLCQKQAHDYHPEHLWRNEEKVPLRNPGFTPRQRWDRAPESEEAYAAFGGEDYAPDLLIEEALGFVRENAARPFFLYFATPVPHVSLQVPEDSLAAYRDLGWDEGPYLGEKGYLPHPAPRAAYAAMISRLDRDVGRLLDLLDELDLDRRTLVVFSSDNGPTYNGGADSAFFASAGGLRGRKGNLYEAGVRVPFLARWPGKLPAGRVDDTPSGFQDFWPTLVELLGAPCEAELDGSSSLPALTGQGAVPRRRPLYWEAGKVQALRDGAWKVLRRVDAEGEALVELYDLEADPAETVDQSRSQPETRARLLRLLDQARHPSTIFRTPLDDLAPPPATDDDRSTRLP